MVEGKRKIGIDIIGDVPWGTHLCQFYQTKKDLIDILVPYFKAGLENNEFCMWVTSEPLKVKDAKIALRKRVKDLDDYIQKGQIEILDCKEWYAKSGKFEAVKVLQGWVEKEKQALKKGFDGLRLTGNAFWLEKKDWKIFTDYEETVNNVISRYKMLVICSYSLDKCGANEIIDVVKNHQFALIKREGKWERIESSERKRVEEEASYEQALMQTLLGNIPDHIYFKDKNRRFVRVSNYFCDLFHLKAVDIIGKRDEELFPKEIAKETSKEDQYIIETGKPLINKIEGGEIGGEEHWVLTTKLPWYDKEGNIIGLFGFSKDVTRLKKSEEELKQQKEFLNAVVETAAEGIDVIDEKGSYHIYNRRMEEITGYSQKEAQNFDFPKLLYPDPAYRAKAIAAIKAALQGKHAKNQEWEMTRKDGAKRWVLISTRLLIHGTHQLMIGFVRDITERKKAEEEKIKAQVIMLAEQKKKVLAEKMAKELKREVARKTQKIKEEHGLRECFIADTSHELRTPLAVLQTNLDLLNALGDRRDFLPGKDFKNLIESNKNQIKYLATIIEELVLLSRGKKPKGLKQKIKLGALVQETVEELRALAQAKGINYKIKILNQGLVIVGDKELLKKLVRNLISNAIKYGREKGKIEIILKKQKGEAELRVADDGVGISKKDLPHIFGRFYRTGKGRSREEGGAGLGLAICQWVVEQHGGKIEVESKYSKGSTFIVSLPFKKS